MVRIRCGYQTESETTEVESNAMKVLKYEGDGVCESIGELHSD